MSNVTAWPGENCRLLDILSSQFATQIIRRRKAATPGPATTPWLSDRSFGATRRWAWGGLLTGLLELDSHLLKPKSVHVQLGLIQCLALRLIEEVRPGRLRLQLSEGSGGQAIG